MKVYGLGLKGEQIARKYLLKKGYKIIATNFQCRFGELDLIAQDQNCLVFCEVKTRSAGMVAAPQESVTPAKQRKMIKTAEHWLGFGGGDRRTEYPQRCHAGYAPCY